MNPLIVVAASAALAACSTSEQRRSDAQLSAGQAIAETHCAACHAVGAVGDSPAPEAPAFQTLARNYRVDTLEEALAEGINVGHPAMPEFMFAPDDVDALIAYLQAIQLEGPVG